MKKLKIPVIKTPSFHSKRLSMDEYLKFVPLIEKPIKCGKSSKP
jgi:hypothetical protein